jgi:class 3 adenylate cyclase
MTVVIGEGTFEAVKDRFECRSLGPRPLKGKEKVVTAYEVQGLIANAQTPPGAATGGA